MKLTHKSISIIASLLLVASTQAQNYGDGDLLIGFTGGGSDFIYDLGQLSTLTLGQTWNLGPGLGTSFGVVGALSSGKHLFATSSDSAENGFDPTALFNTAASNVRTISGQPLALTVGLSRTTSSTDTTGWTYQTGQPAGTPGNTFQNNFFNPNVSAGTFAYLFDNANAGTVTPAHGFLYNSVSGQLTFTDVPEPAAAWLFAGGTVLVMALRARKNLRA